LKTSRKGVSIRVGAQAESSKKSREHRVPNQGGRRSKKIKAKETIIANWSKANRREKNRKKAGDIGGMAAGLWKKSPELTKNKKKEMGKGVFALNCDVDRGGKKKGEKPGERSGAGVFVKGQRSTG